MIPSDLRLDLAQAMGRLTEKQRWALLLVCYMGYTQEEAGEMCGVSQQAMSERVQLAAGKMREYMT